MDNQLEQAIQLIQSGDKTGGGELIVDFIRDNPRNDFAWTWLSTCTNSIDQKIKYLHKALEINPNNAWAKTELAKYSNPDPQKFSFKENPKSASDIGQKPDKEESNKFNSIIDNDNLMKRIIFGLSILATIVVVGLIIFFSNRSSSTALPTKTQAILLTKTQDELKLFNQQAVKLSVMTSQGVNYVDFRNQLTEVKTAYALIDFSWSGDYASIKSDFDKSISAWNTCITVWDKKINDNQGDYDFLPEDNARGLAVKWGLNPDEVWMNNYKTWISTFMTIANDAYDSGWSKMKTYIQ